MPRSRNNSLTYGLSGNFAGMACFHMRSGKQYVRKIQAKRSVPDSEKQESNKERFSECIAYAKVAIKDPQLKAFYLSRAKPGQSAYNIAFQDAYKGPKITKFNMENYRGRIGDSLFVDATDKFKVLSVIISIYNASGNLIEQGSAVMQQPFDHEWLYIAAVANEPLAGSKITATAMDRPGNKASLELML